MRSLAISDSGSFCSLCYKTVPDRSRSALSPFLRRGFFYLLSGSGHAECRDKDANQRTADRAEGERAGREAGGRDGRAVICGGIRLEIDEYLRRVGSLISDFSL